MNLTRPSLACALGAVLFVSACSEDSGKPGTDPVDAGTTPDVTLGPCGADHSAVAVVTSIRFVRETEPGVSEGLDLDDFVTRGRDDTTGCGREDMTSPDGTPGIDNQFAKLLPTLETVGGEAIEGLVQAAINNGELLLMLRVDHLDSVRDDACVDVRIARGVGQPLIGSDGRILPGQTFDLDEERPSQFVPAMAIADGVLTAGPFDIELPLQVFDVFVRLNARQGFARLTLQEDGSMRGILAGAIPIADILKIAQDAGDEQVTNVLRRIVGANADLLPDAEGKCTAISAALHLEVQPAWFYPDITFEGSGSRP